jgi:hypothetical protein
MIWRVEVGGWSNGGVTMTQMDRPKHIWYFWYLILGAVLLCLLDLAAEQVGITKPDPALPTPLILIGLGINLFLAWLTFQRKNWARWIYSANIVLGLPWGFEIMSRELQVDRVGFFSGSIGYALILVGIVFLFTKQSREWFKTSKQTPAPSSEV